jgi:hypothetical protein
MVLPISPNVDNLYKGGGHVYLADRDEDGNPKGLVDCGNAPVFEGQPDVTYDEHFSSLVANFEKDVSRADQVAMKYTGELEEYSIHNLNIAVLGDEPHAISQLSGSGIEADLITVDRLDAWYKTGSKNITVQSLEDADENPYEEGADADFIVDAEKGWIKPLSTGTITVGMVLIATITRTNWAAEEVRPLVNPTIEKYLHFYGNPKSGPLLEAEIWKCRVTIKAAFPLISKDYGKIGFEVEVLSDRGNHTGTPFGRIRATVAA